MTVIGYIFLDTNRDELITLATQQEMLEAYARGLGLQFDELLVEQSYSPATPFVERTEGRPCWTMSLRVMRCLLFEPSGFWGHHRRRCD